MSRPCTGSSSNWPKPSGALLAHLAELTVRRGCARLEWWVLRTNEPALRFYRRLRARALDEIEIMRLDGEVLHDVAANIVPAR